jgi:hypothetical protein
VTKITLGGRPAEEGGHKSIKLSLNHDIHKCLVKIREKGKNASKFVENYLESPCTNLDPGPACPAVSKVAQILDEELASAYRDRDYSKMQVLAGLRGRLEPEVAACGLSIPTNVPEKKKSTDSV